MRLLKIFDVEEYVLQEDLAEVLDRLMKAKVEIEEASEDESNLVQEDEDEANYSSPSQ